MHQEDGNAALAEKILITLRLSTGTVIMERHSDGPPGVDNQDSSLWDGLSPPGRMHQGAAWSRDPGGAVQAQAELRMRQSSRQGREL